MYIELDVLQHVLLEDIISRSRTYYKRIDTDLFIEKSLMTIVFLFNISIISFLQEMPSKSEPAVQETILDTTTTQPDEDMTSAATQPETEAPPTVEETTTVAGDVDEPVLYPKDPLPLPFDGFAAADAGEHEHGLVHGDIDHEYLNEVKEPHAHEKEDVSEDEYVSSTTEKERHKENLHHAGSSAEEEQVLPDEPAVPESQAPESLSQVIENVVDLADKDDALGVTDDSANQVGEQGEEDQGAEDQTETTAVQEGTTEASQFEEDDLEVRLGPKRPAKPQVVPSKDDESVSNDQAAVQADDTDRNEVDNETQPEKEVLQQLTNLPLTVNDEDEVTPEDGDNEVETEFVDNVQPADNVHSEIKPVHEEASEKDDMSKPEVEDQRPDEQLEGVVGGTDDSHDGKMQKVKQGGKDAAKKDSEHKESTEHAQKDELVNYEEKGDKKEEHDKESGNVEEAKEESGKVDEPKEENGQPEDNTAEGEQENNPLEHQTFGDGNDGKQTEDGQDKPNDASNKPEGEVEEEKLKEEKLEEQKLAEERPEGEKHEAENSDEDKVEEEVKSDKEIPKEEAEEDMPEKDVEEEKPEKETLEGYTDEKKPKEEVVEEGKPEEEAEEGNLEEEKVEEGKPEEEVEEGEPEQEVEEGEPEEEGEEEEPEEENPDEEEKPNKEKKPDKEEKPDEEEKLEGNEPEGEKVSQSGQFQTVDDDQGQEDFDDTQQQAAAEEGSNSDSETGVLGEDTAEPTTQVTTHAQDGTTEQPTTQAGEDGNSSQDANPDKNKEEAVGSRYSTHLERYN